MYVVQNGPGQNKFLYVGDTFYGIFLVKVVIIILIVG
jgi:hypothetical protein